VTTKKAGKNKFIVKVGNVTTFERVSYLPELQDRFGGGSGETYDPDNPNYTFWVGPDRNTDPYSTFENQNYGSEYNGQMVMVGGKLEDGSYQMLPYSPIKNQKLNFFNTGITTQNDISLSGGDEKNAFYVSFQDVNTTGVIPNDKNRRSSVRLSASKGTERFRSDFSISYTRTNTSVSGGDMSQGRPVYWNVLNTPAHIPFTQYKDIDNYKFATLNGYFNAYYPNPYWQIEHARNNTLRQDVLGSLRLTFKPLDWLEISNRTGLIYDNRNYHNYKDEAIYSSYSASDPWGQGHMGVNSPYPGYSFDRNFSSIILNNDFLVISDKKFNAFTLKAIAGVSIYSRKVASLSTEAGQLVIPEFYNISNRVGEPVVNQYYLNRNSIGAFGDVTLTYKDFATIHVSGRNDWDSRLVKEQRSFFYPAVDAAVTLSDIIPAIKDNAILSFLKIRGGWSKTGQVALDNWYATIPSYVAGDGFPYGSNAGFRLSTTLSNPNLKPELTTEIETGIDMSFLRNRLHLETTFYKSNTVDQTIPATISSTTGYYGAYINAGELETRGIELELKATPVLMVGGFVWNARVSYSYSTSEVISITEDLKDLFIPTVTDGISTGVSHAIVGQQFPTLMVTDVERDPQGRIIVDPVTGLPKKAEATVNAGHGNPNHILGISTDFNYKGLRLSIVMEYRGGARIYNAVGNALDFTGTSAHSAQNGRQPFVIPNSVIETSPGVFEPNTNVTVLDASRNFWVSSDYHNVQRTYVTSADFWKLREVAITYNIPVHKLWGGKVIKEAQVGIVGRNLLLLRPKTNVWTDPEFNNSSAETNAVGVTTEDQTPPTRIYGFNINLTF
ncbi:MAG: TonB-dependent receptor, partial [Chloroflexia bacterium]|nr:TonB-dependent receptor [Chloroflexia bacterium]